VDVLIAVEVEAIVVEVDAIVDAHTIQPHSIAFQNAHAVVGAAREEDIAYLQIPAAIKDGEVRTLAVALGAVAARTGVVALAGVKELSLAVDGSGTFDGDVLGVHGI